MLCKPIDISIPLKFNGAQPNAYGVEKALQNLAKREVWLATRGAAEAAISSNTNLFRIATAHIPNASVISRTSEFLFENVCKMRLFPQL